MPTSDIWEWLKKLKYLFSERENISNKRFLFSSVEILYYSLCCTRESFFVTRSAVYVVRSIKQNWMEQVFIIIFFWWTSDSILDQQVIIFLMFFNSFDHMFTSKGFKIVIQKLSRNCLLKTLSMTIFTTVYFFRIL